MGVRGRLGGGHELADFLQWLLKQLLLLHGDNDRGRGKKSGSTDSTLPAAHTRRQQIERD